MHTIFDSKICYNRRGAWIRMAMGLGMTSEEWLNLKGKVDDSFWVMRIIGQDQLSSNVTSY